MAKIPLDVRRDALYIASRRVLLDALYALAGQRDALILVGAQAVYLRTGDANLSVAAFTADADLGVDRSLLTDLPRLEQAMLDAEFQLGTNPAARQPGQWFRAVEIDGQRVDIPVDLLIPGRFSGTASSRRTADLAPHNRMAVRKVDGLEIAIVDNEIVQVHSLEPSVDSRSVDIKVAGISALLTAKAHKIRDRVSENNPDRAADKDAGDVIRMMRASDPRDTGAIFVELLANTDDRIRDTASVGLSLLKDQFGRARGAGIEMAERSLAGAISTDTIRGLAIAYLRELPDGIVN